MDVDIDYIDIQFKSDDEQKQHTHYLNKSFDNEQKQHINNLNKSFDDEHIYFHNFLTLSQRRQFNIQHIDTNVSCDCCH